MQFSAVVLDLDGTLLNSNKGVSARNLRALLDIHHRSGVKIIYATARPPKASNDDDDVGIILERLNRVTYN